MENKGFISVNARGTVIEMPYDIINKSPVIKSWATGNFDNSKPFYINRSPDEMHKMLNEIYQQDKSDIYDELLIEKPNVKCDESIVFKYNYNNNIFYIIVYFETKILSFEIYQYGDYRITYLNSPIISSSGHYSKDSPEYDYSDNLLCAKLKQTADLKRRISEIVEFNKYALSVKLDIPIEKLVSYFKYENIKVDPSVKFSHPVFELS